MLKKVCYILLITIFFSLLPVAHAHSYEIKGVIRDAQGGTIKGALVEVTCRGITKKAETSGGGLFSVNFSLEQCTEQDMVTVKAMYNDLFGFGSSNANGENLRIDLQLSEPTEVPEYTYVTTLLAIVLSSGAYFYLTKYSRI